MRIISLIVACLFLLNDTVFALSPELRTIQEKFKDTYAGVYDLVMSSNFNSYVASKLPKGGLNELIRDQSSSIRYDSYDLGGETNVVVVVGIDGLEAATKGAIKADVRFVKEIGKPVIYMDQKEINNEAIRRDLRAKIAGWHAKIHPDAGVVDIAASGPAGNTMIISEGPALFIDQDTYEIRALFSSEHNALHQALRKLVDFEIPASDEFDANGVRRLCDEEAKSLFGAKAFDVACSRGPPVSVYIIDDASLQNALPAGYRRVGRGLITHAGTFRTPTTRIPRAMNLFIPRSIYNKLLSLPSDSPELRFWRDHEVGHLLARESPIDRKISDADKLLIEHIGMALDLESPENEIGAVSISDISDNVKLSPEEVKFMDDGTIPGVCKEYLRQVKESVFTKIRIWLRKQGVHFSIGRKDSRIQRILFGAEFKDLRSRILDDLDDSKDIANIAARHHITEIEVRLMQKNYGFFRTEDPFRDEGLERLEKIRAWEAIETEIVNKILRLYPTLINIAAIYGRQYSTVMANILSEELKMGISTVRLFMIESSNVIVALESLRTKVNDHLMKTSISKGVPFVGWKKDEGPLFAGSQQNDRVSAASIKTEARILDSIRRLGDSYITQRRQFHLDNNGRYFTFGRLAAWANCSSEDVTQHILNNRLVYQALGFTLSQTYTLTLNDDTRFYFDRLPYVILRKAKIAATQSGQQHMGFGIVMSPNGGAYKSESEFNAIVSGPVMAAVQSGVMPQGYLSQVVDIMTGGKNYHFDLVLKDEFDTRLRQQGLTIQRFIEDCIKIRAPTPERQSAILDNLEKNLSGKSGPKKLIIDAVRFSPSLYGNCDQDGYMYVNVSSPLKLDLVGISHEILHEAGEQNEDRLLGQDLVLISKLGMDYDVVMHEIKPLVSAFSPLTMMLIEAGSYLRRGVSNASTAVTPGSKDIVSPMTPEQVSQIEEIIARETAHIHGMIDAEIRAFPPCDAKRKITRELSPAIMQAYREMFIVIAKTAGKDIPAIRRLLSEIEAGKFSEQMVMSALEESFIKSGRYIVFDTKTFNIKEINDGVLVPSLCIYKIQNTYDLDANILGRHANVLAIALEKATVTGYDKYRFGYSKTIAATNAELRTNGAVQIIYDRESIDGELQEYYEWMSYLKKKGNLPAGVATGDAIIDNAIVALLEKQWPSFKITTTFQEFRKDNYNGFLGMLLRHETMHTIMHSPGELASLLLDISDSRFHWVKLVHAIRYIFKRSGVTEAQLQASIFVLGQALPMIFEKYPQISMPRIPKDIYAGASMRQKGPGPYSKSLFKALPNLSEKALKSVTKELLETLIQAKEAQNDARDRAALTSPADMVNRDMAKFTHSAESVTFGELLSEENKLYSISEKAKLNSLLCRYDIKRGQSVAKLLRSEKWPYFVKWELHEVLIDKFIASFYEDDSQNNRRMRAYGGETSDKFGISGNGPREELREVSKVKEFFKDVLGQKNLPMILDYLMTNGQINILNVGERRPIFLAHASFRKRFNLNICSSAKNFSDMSGPEVGAIIVHEIMALSGSADDPFNDSVGEAYLKWRMEDRSYLDGLADITMRLSELTQNKIDGYEPLDLDKEFAKEGVVIPDDKIKALQDIFLKGDSLDRDGRRSLYYAEALSVGANLLDDKGSTDAANRLYRKALNLFLAYIKQTAHYNSNKFMEYGKSSDAYPNELRKIMDFDEAHGVQKMLWRIANDDKRLKTLGIRPDAIFENCALISMANKDLEFLRAGTLNAADKERELLLQTIAAESYEGLIKDIFVAIILGRDRDWTKLDPTLTPSSSGASALIQPAAETGATHPEDIFEGLNEQAREDLKNSLMGIEGYSRIPRTQAGGKSFYSVLKAAKALQNMGYTILAFEEEFRAGDIKGPPYGKVSEKLNENTKLKVDIVASLTGADGKKKQYLVEVKLGAKANEFLEPHDSYRGWQRTLYSAFAELLGYEVILVSGGPIKGYPIKQMVPLRGERSIKFLSISETPYISELQQIKCDRTLMSNAMDETIGIKYKRDYKELIEARILVPVKGKMKYYRFADMMMNKERDADYTGTLINALDNVDLSLPMPDVIHAVRMEILNEMAKEITVPQENIMYHIIEQGVIPIGQRASLVQAVNNAFYTDKRRPERIRMLKQGEKIADVIAEVRAKAIAENKGAIIDVALSNKSQIEMIGDTDVKKMVFETEDIEFIQFEGVIKALRALHFDDADERLSGICLAMVGRSVEDLLYRKNGIYVLRLPKIGRNNINSIPKLNERLLELLASA